MVLDADRLVAEIYQSPDVLSQLTEWWGPTIRKPDGTLNRPAVAAIVFSNPSERARLEGLVHPRVHALCRERMRDALLTAPVPRAFVWDIPLLIETGRQNECDRLVYVDTPLEVRLERAKSRGWTPQDLARREAAQTGLDTKRSLAHHVVSGVADEAAARLEVERILSELIPLEAGRYNPKVDPPSP